MSPLIWPHCRLSYLVTPSLCVPFSRRSPFVFLLSSVALPLTVLSVGLAGQRTPISLSHQQPLLLRLSFLFKFCVFFCASVIFGCISRLLALSEMQRADALDCRLSNKRASTRAREGQDQVCELPFLYLMSNAYCQGLGRGICHSAYTSPFFETRSGTTPEHKS